MVTTTSLRSRPSTRSLQQSTPPRLLIQDTPANNSHTKNTNGQYSPTKDMTTSKATDQTSTGAQESHGHDSSAMEEDDDDADDEAEDAEAMAPSRKDPRRRSTTPGAVGLDGSAGAGASHDAQDMDDRKDEVDDEDVAMTDAQDSSALDDLKNYAFSDDGSVADATFKEDDEDDYDAVDDVSETSDDSNAVEQDFERDIIAEDMGLGKSTRGIEGIDWDRPETFEMSDWQSGYYGCIDDNGELLTTETYELQQKVNADNRRDEAARLQLAHSHPYSAMQSNDSSTSGSSSGSSPRNSSSPRRPVAGLTRRSSAYAPDDDDGSDTDDDEDFVQDRAIRGLLSSDDHSEPGGARVSRLMTEEELSPSPASQLSSEALIYPQMRRVVPDSDRPIAFFGENILGTKCLQYELPALGDWCWVSTQYENGRLRIHQRLPIDLQSIHSPISESDSGRNSPTMIDLQAAVTEGNTNTGAPVFDMIQGHLFAATHCPRRFEDSFDLSPQPASSFLHRFTSFDPGSSFNDVLDQASLNIGGSATSHCSVNDFLHLDACAEPSSSEPSPPVGFAATVESDFPIAPPMAAWSPTQVDEQAIGALGPPFSSPNEAPDTIMMDARHPPFELPGTSPSHSIEAEAPPASPLTPRKRRRSIDSTNESAFDITSPKKARNHDLIPVAASS